MLKLLQAIQVLITVSAVFIVVLVAQRYDRFVTIEMMLLVYFGLYAILTVHFYIMRHIRRLRYFKGKKSRAS